MTMHRWNCVHCEKNIANGKGGIILHCANARKYYADKREWDKANPSNGHKWMLVDMTAALSKPRLPDWYPTHWDCSDGDHSYEIAVERVRTDKQLISWLCHFNGKRAPYRTFSDLVKAKTGYTS